MTEPLIIHERPSRSAAVALLQAQGLPFSDITVDHLEHFFFIEAHGSPTGLVGVEIYGTDALLRSLVIAEEARNQGLGSALVRHAEDYAAARQIRVMYLLTTTAENFFQRRGYQRVDRTQAPGSIRSTPEFAGLCPANSAFMSKQI
jgi:amino-acid N-acetyltransferase